VFRHGGSLNSVDDPTTRGRLKCRFSTTGTGNGSVSDNSSSWTRTYCRSRAYHWTFGGNCAVFGRRLLHGIARHAQPIGLGRWPTTYQPSTLNKSLAFTLGPHTFTTDWGMNSVDCVWECTWHKFISFHLFKLSKCT